jgi:hypothetical protein
VEHPTPGDTEVRPPLTGVGELRLTYATIAARLGITADAARQLVRRRGWRRIKPNRLGAPATIIIPEDELAAEQWREDHLTPPDAPRAEKALTGERARADSLRDRLEAAERAQRDAQEAAEELRQAEMARQARGLLARLRAAWRSD